MKNISQLLILILISTFATSQGDGFLGLAVKTVKVDNKNTARVAEVFENSPSSLNLMQTNDLIIAVNGEKISRGPELIKKIKHFSWGEEVKLTIIRDNQEITKNIILGKRTNHKTYYVRHNKVSDRMVVWRIDKNTTIHMLNGEPFQVTKRINNKNISIDENEIKAGEFSQNFLDVNDKIALIRTIEKKYKDNIPASLNLTKKYIKEESLSTETIKKQNIAFDVFPNPSSDIVTIKFKSNKVFKDKTTYRVIDVNGKQIIKSKEVNLTNKDNFTIDISSFENGMYLLQIIEGENIFAERIQKI